MRKQMDRMGEIRIMNCGMKATIIKYRNSHDIDIQFEDGTIVKHKQYGNFIKGEIFNPNCRIEKTRIGETRIMNCGMRATIINYRNNRDIDIQFEDGTIVKHRAYSNFIKGDISNPNCRIEKTRIGETRIMNCGMKATIIKYRNSNDIDIQFEDGTIVKHKQYCSFKKGEISNPNYMIAVSISCNEFIMYYYLEKYGFIKAKKGSLKNLGFGQMELDCYHPVYKIAIEYDGNVHVTKENNDKQKNKICKQNEITIIRIREPKCPILNDNSIEYRIDSDKRFSSSFENILKTVFQYINSITELKINENISFEQDKKHILKVFNEQYINIYAKSRIGETNFSSKGQKMTIIKYRNSHDIDIQFEDGTIVKHKQYNNFKKGDISNPNYKIVETRIGETRIMNCGMKATIIKYRNSNDIDIQFEDGTIVKHKTYGSFIKGGIFNPNYRIGEIRMMNCGMKATIINYRNNKDIDIQFEDGTIVKHKQYNNFKKGDISNPNCRIGETRIMNNGMKATIIKYRKSIDIDVQFEDGTIVEHRTYNSFKNGTISNPNCRKLAA